VARSGLVALALAFAACKPDGGALDRSDLQAAMSADENLDDALKKADDAERAGRDDDAADILKRTAEPAADQALATANALAPRTDWGRKEKDALTALERDRKDEVGRYEAALRSGDVEQKIAALKKQLDIEQRAKGIAEEVAAGP
jgi:hypothetical protein